MAKAKIIYQVLPRIEPVIDGVGDYATTLSKALSSYFNIQSVFMITDLKWQCHKHPPYPVVQITSHREDAFIDCLGKQKFESLTLLLHYVGYGYAHRGCPFWLIAALKKLKRHAPNLRIVTMFHELSAFSAPWRSAFWIGWIQRDIARQIVGLSDRIITSNAAYARVFAQWKRCPIEHISVLPVISSVGEPSNILPLANRMPYLITFGKNRGRIFAKCHKHLDRICAALRLTRIIDIGPPSHKIISHVANIPVISMGELAALDVSRIMQNAYAGYFNCPPHFFAKSSVVAAYCAHGLLPVTHTVGPETDEAVSNRIYWSLTNKIPDAKLAQEIATNAHSWYKQHDLNCQTKVYAARLNGSL